MSSEPRNLRELLRGAFGLYAGHGFKLLKILLVFLIPIFFINEFFWENQPLINQLIAQYSLKGFYLIDDALNFIIILFAFLYFIAEIQYLRCALLHQTLGVWQAWRQAFGIFGDYLNVKILFLIKVFLWSLVLIVPGIIFAVLYSFHSMALLMDGKKGMEALKFSKDLIKPHVFLYTGYLLVLLSSIFAFSYPLLFILDFLKEASPLWVEKILSYLQVLAVGMVVNFGIVFYYVIYEELTRILPDPI